MKGKSVYSHPPPVTRHPSLVTEACTHGGFTIGGSRFRAEIENALKLRATPRGQGRPTVGVRL